MRKVIAAINMTLDGVCDHTAGIADEQLHQHYAELVDNAGVILYGRITYQLMLFWPTLLEHPSEDKSMNDFALSIDKIEKLVFSHTMNDAGWQSARLAGKSPEEEIAALQQQPGKDILIGSRSLIIQLLNKNLIDEFQLCIHPLIEGNGLLLFDQVKERIAFDLLKTKFMDSGAAVFYYRPQAAPIL